MVTTAREPWSPSTHLVVVERPELGVPERVGVVTNPAIDRLLGVFHPVEVALGPRADPVRVAAPTAGDLARVGGGDRPDRRVAVGDAVQDVHDVAVVVDA